MYNFILQTVVMVSLATIIYLFARAVPRVQETSPEEGSLEKLLEKIPFEKADAFVSMVFEKTLRKLKVVVARLDAILSQRLRGLKPGMLAGKNAAAEKLFQPVSSSSEKVEKK
ncbi:hypothetical protein KGO95_02095 [Patescibacteria group bacterium]|nr:hypothetical protein [Patescibacteria group bacterium]